MIKTALMLLPVFALVALAFWFILPPKSPLPMLISEQKQQSQPTDISNITGKIDLLEDKIGTLESSNSQLLSKITELEAAKSSKATTIIPSGKKSPVLIPINPGGNVNSTSWTNLTSGSITIDPADYAGYKNAFLIVNLSVYRGQGTAYAQLVNTVNTLAIIPSQVSTTSFSPVTLTSLGFQLPKGSNTYTIQLYTQISGYPAQAEDSFLQITY